MAAQRPMEMDERSESTGKALKRRGILAAAGAAVAGIVAKQASQPVAAVGTVGLGSSSNSTDTPTVIINHGPASTLGPALGGYRSENSYSTVFINLNAGVAGISEITDTDGVYGEAKGGFYAKGVHGVTTSGYGIYGEATGSGGFGVIGIATDSYGVTGRSASGTGVQGDITGGSTANTRAVKGLNLSSGAGGVGVYGACVGAGGVGVYGQSAATGGYGVLGAAVNPSSIGVGGTAYTDGSSAFSGGTSNPNAYAGYFQGNVVVAGRFDVSPLGNKHGVAPHPDGTHRTFYSVESPECWVEDFGTGTLANGKAEVALDADFALLAHTDRYHVFITGVDEHHHLIAKGKTATGFTVEADGELAKLKGKKAGELVGTFSYRIVARPKTTAKVERLAKATLPNLPLPPLPKAELAELRKKP